MAILGTLKSANVLVSGDSGIDIEATLDALKAVIAAEVESTSIQDKEIEAALDDVYHRLGVDVYQTPAIVSMAAATLCGNDVTAMASKSEAVRDFLSRSSRFVGVRGRNGGLKKVS